MSKQFSYKLLLVLAILFIMGVVFLEPLLNSVSRALVHEDHIVKSDAIVVLAGGNGSRIEAAAKLYQEGFGEKLFFSGFRVYPETYTSTLMKNYAIKLKVPAEKIITWIPDVEVSTKGESVANLELLKNHNIKKIILVTSAFHTRRAKLLYEKAISELGYDISILVYPAPDPLVPIDGWWKLRTGQKSIFFEYVKSIAYYFNL